MIWIRIALMVLFAAAGYQRATWFRARYGRTQWGWPPLAWAAVCGLSLVIGAVCLVIAERSGREAGELAQPAAQAAPAPSAHRWQ